MSEEKPVEDADFQPLNIPKPLALELVTNRAYLYLENHLIHLSHGHALTSAEVMGASDGQGMDRLARDEAIRCFTIRDIITAVRNSAKTPGEIAVSVKWLDNEESPEA